MVQNFFKFGPVESQSRRARRITKDTKPLHPTPRGGGGRGFRGFVWTGWDGGWGFVIGFEIATVPLPSTFTAVADNVFGGCKAGNGSEKILCDSV